MARFALVIEIFVCGAFLPLAGTDAVEPWSAPDSLKIEQNEEIHVSEFRTEQLIIGSTHPSYTDYQRYPDGKWIPFGPIFHLELLNQVIASITRCIAPIYSHLCISQIEASTSPPPRAYPGHLTPFPAREGENLITTRRGWGI